MNRKRVVIIFFIVTFFTLLGITNTYAAEQKITEITSSSTEIKKAVSGEKIYNPKVNIDSVNPSEAKSNLRTYNIWYHDGEEIPKEQIENNNVKFEQGKYQLLVYFEVINSNKNIIDYEKFPQTIKLNEFEFSINTKCEYYVGYSITFNVECNSNTKPTIKTGSLPNGNKMMKYSFNLKGWGSDTITWSLTNGSKLPKGLSVSKDGILSGTPKEAGEFIVEVKASNNYGEDIEKYTLTINDIDVITSAKLSSTQARIPKLGEKIYFPKINIDDINIKSAKENCYTYAYWEHNCSEIREEDSNVKNLKFEPGEYTLYVYFAIYPEKITKNLVDYEEFSNDSIKLNEINFTIQAKSLYYIGYSTTFKVDVPKPKKVQGLYVKSQKEDEVTLKWSKNGGNVTGYKVYQYNSKTKKWDYVGKTSNTNYTIKKLKAGTTYSFRVRAYKTIDGTQYFGPYSTSLKTATKPLATRLEKLSIKNKKVSMRWNKVSGATGYEIYMAINKKKDFEKIKTIKDVKTVKYTTKKLKKNNTYYFKIKAYKTVNGIKVYSAYSNTRQIKVK